VDIRRPKRIALRFLPKERERDRVEIMEHAEAFNCLQTGNCLLMEGSQGVIQRIDRDLVVGQNQESVGLR